MFHRTYVRIAAHSRRSTSPATRRTGSASRSASSLATDGTPGSSASSVTRHAASASRSVSSLTANGTTPSSVLSPSLVGSSYARSRTHTFVHSVLNTSGVFRRPAFGRLSTNRGGSSGSVSPSIGFNGAAVSKYGANGVVGVAGVVGTGRRRHSMLAPSGLSGGSRNSPKRAIGKQDTEASRLADRSPSNSPASLTTDAQLKPAAVVAATEAVETHMAPRYGGNVSRDTMFSLFPGVNPGEPFTAKKPQAAAPPPPPQPQSQPQPAGGVAMQQPPQRSAPQQQPPQRSAQQPPAPSHEASTRSPATAEEAGALRASLARCAEEAARAAAKMSAAQRAQMSENASKAFASMLRARVRPNISDANLLMATYSNCGDFESLARFLPMLKRSSLVSNEETLMAFLGILRHRVDQPIWSSLDVFLNDLAKHNVTPDAPALRSPVRTLALDLAYSSKSQTKAGAAPGDTSARLLTVLSERGYQADGELLLALLKFMDSRGGSLQAAREVFKLHAKWERAPGRGALHRYSTILVKHDKFDEAVEAVKAHADRFDDIFGVKRQPSALDFSVVNKGDFSRSPFAQILLAVKLALLGLGTINLVPWILGRHVGPELAVRAQNPHTQAALVKTLREKCGVKTVYPATTDEHGGSGAGGKRGNVTGGNATTFRVPLLTNNLLPMETSQQIREDLTAQIDRRIQSVAHSGQREQLLRRFRHALEYSQVVPSPRAFRAAFAMNLKVPREEIGKNADEIFNLIQSVHSSGRPLDPLVVENFLTPFWNRNDADRTAQFYKKFKSVFNFSSPTRNTLEQSLQCCLKANNAAHADFFLKEYLAFTEKPSPIPPHGTMPDFLRAPLSAGAGARGGGDSRGASSEVLPLLAGARDALDSAARALSVFNQTYTDPQSRAQLPPLQAMAPGAPGMQLPPLQSMPSGAPRLPLGGSGSGSAVSSPSLNISPSSDGKTDSNASVALDSNLIERARALVEGRNRSPPPPVPVPSSSSPRPGLPPGASQSPIRQMPYSMYPSNPQLPPVAAHRPPLSPEDQARMEKLSADMESAIKSGKPHDAVAQFALVANSAAASSGGGSSAAALSYAPMWSVAMRACAASNPPNVTLAQTFLELMVANRILSAPHVEEYLKVCERSGRFDLALSCYARLPSLWQGRAPPPSLLEQMVHCALPVRDYASAKRFAHPLSSTTPSRRAYESLLKLSLHAGEFADASRYLSALQSSANDGGLQHVDANVDEWNSKRAMRRTLAETIAYLEESGRGSNSSNNSAASIRWIFDQVAEKFDLKPSEDVLNSVLLAHLQERPPKSSSDRSTSEDVDKRAQELFTKYDTRSELILQTAGNGPIELPEQHRGIAKAALLCAWNSVRSKFFMDAASTEVSSPNSDPDPDTQASTNNARRKDILLVRVSSPAMNRLCTKFAARHGVAWWWADGNVMAICISPLSSSPKASKNDADKTASSSSTPHVAAEVGNAEPLRLTFEDLCRVWKGSSGDGNVAAPAAVSQAEDVFSTLLSKYISSRDHESLLSFFRECVYPNSGTENPSESPRLRSLQRLISTERFLDIVKTVPKVSDILWLVESHQKGGGAISSDTYSYALKKCVDAKDASSVDRLCASAESFARSTNKSAFSKRAYEWLAQLPDGRERFATFSARFGADSPQLTAAADFLLQKCGNESTEFSAVLDEMCRLYDVSSLTSVPALRPILSQQQGSAPSVGAGANTRKARVDSSTFLAIMHIACRQGDYDAALDFYRSFFFLGFRARGKEEAVACLLLLNVSARAKKFDMAESALSLAVGRRLEGSFAKPDAVSSVIRTMTSNCENFDIPVRTYRLFSRAINHGYADTKNAKVTSEMTPPRLQSDEGNDASFSNAVLDLRSFKSAPQAMVATVNALDSVNPAASKLASQEDFKRAVSSATRWHTLTVKCSESSVHSSLKSLFEHNGFSVTTTAQPASSNSRELILRVQKPLSDSQKLPSIPEQWLNPSQRS